MLNFVLLHTPEVSYTINIVRGFLYKNIPLLWIVGIIFSLCIFILFFIKKFVKRVRIINNNFRLIIICLILIFWLPLFINLFYNNVYDFTDNLDYYKYDISGKRIIRLCNIDHYQKLGNVYCRIFSFILYTKNTLQTGETIKILSHPFMANYFQYYFYPYFNFTDSIEKADYLVYYYSSDFYYQDNILYKKFSDNKDEIVGRYDIVGARGSQEIILKKMKE